VERITNNRWLFFILGFFLGAVITLFFYDKVVNVDECQEIAKTGDSVVINGDFYVPLEEKPEKIHTTKKDISVDKPETKSEKHNVREVGVKQEINDTAMTETEDSAYVDTDSIAVDYTEPGDIEVMQDELLFSKHIEPEGDVTVFLCDAAGEYDSLLVDNTAVKHQEGLTVEFWVSPVNFKGYKLNSRKLVLFGVVQFDSLNLRYEKEKVLLMKYKNQEFQLHCSDDFIPLNIRN
jgi:hypothetical protein